MPPPDPRRAYVLHRAIAAGGAATVHLGRLLAPGGFARRVAIKRLHPALAQEPEVAASFAEEARLSARVAHANIAAILDVVSADGELLLVMEYVHGETLSRLLMTSRAAATPVAIPIVAGVMTDVLHGLHAAHEATGADGAPLRLVHRDVSPQNVIVGTDGSARVVDFGIAKALAGSPLTRDGGAKGKVPYMAPEQLLRRAIDRRIDVYAAGVILWEALAGRRLFAADDEATLFDKVLEEPVVPPSRLREGVPAALDAITMRALERDPEKRFATAREMAIALEGAVARAPLSVVGDWVEATAQEALAKRAAMIAEMEREAAADAARGGSQHEVRAPSASVIFRDESASPRETGAAVAIAPEPATRGHRREAIAIGVASVIGATIAIAWLALRPAPPPMEAAPASPPASSAPSVPSASIAPAPPEPAAPIASDPAPVAPPSPPATTTAEKRPSAPSRATAVRWCKVFDAEKKIFVMKPMRTSRCP